MYRVAIVIVTWNSAAEIGGCLDALKALPPGTAEVVVVDNASADDTRDEVTRHTVCLIANSTNRGFASAVNQGVQATSAPLILLLNPDAHLVGGLDALMSRFEDPTTGVAGGLLLDESGSPQAGFMARNLPTAAALILEVLGVNRLWPRNPVNWHYRCRGLDPMTAARVEQPAGAFLMFPRSVWQMVGGFDERFHPVWFEDVDFCARVKKAGLLGWYDPGAVAKHAGAHSIRALELVNRERYWYGNLLEYASRHFGSVRFRTVCLAVTAGAVLRAVHGFSGGGRKAIAVYCRVAGLALGRLVSPQRKLGKLLSDQAM
jgi:GT2 family glycosyltransferase